MSRLEKTLNEINLIYDYSISKFDKDFVYYQIIYNGTPNNFLKSMEKQNFNFNTQSKTCLLYTSPSPRDATLSRMPSSA